MNLILIILIVLIVVVLPVYLSIRLLKTNNHKNTRENIIKVKKEDWQKRNIVNAFIYYTLPWIVAFMVTTIGVMYLFA